MTGIDHTRCEAFMGKTIGDRTRSAVCLGSRLGNELTLEHWADSVGLAATRSTGVFAIGDGLAVFVTEHRKPSGLSTAYVVEVEMSGGEIISMTERRPET